MIDKDVKEREPVHILAIIGNNVEIPQRIWKVANGLLILPPEYLHPKKTGTFLKEKVYKYILGKHVFSRFS